MDRPQLQAMLDYVREGDTVYIHDFSRLARSTRDLLEIVERLQAKSVHLVSNKEKPGHRDAYREAHAHHDCRHQ